MYVIPVKIRRLRDRFILIMIILMLIRRQLYIETAPSALCDVLNVLGEQYTSHVSGLFSQDFPTNGFPI